MYEILMVIYLVVALALVGFILIQQGKGAGMGSSFGGGASGTVFGASGSGNFLTKTTTFLAIVFFGVALGLGNLTSNKTATVDEDDLFAGETVNQAPVNEKTELPATELPADTTGDLPVDNTSSDLPVENAAGDLPAGTEIPASEDPIKNDNSEDSPEEKDGTDN